MQLLVATRSAGKQREIRALLAGQPFDPVFPQEIGLITLPEEDVLERDGTYAENALAKARYFAARSGLPTVADDSGIEVDALGGLPGVRSARWSGARAYSGRSTEHDVAAANNALLLERLRGVPAERRTARYRCVVAYVPASGAPPEVVEATCEGRILEAPAGGAGFGYDPLFWSADLRMSFGEAPAAEKDRVSHRGKAFRGVIALLRQRTEG